MGKIKFNPSVSERILWPIVGGIIAVALFYYFKKDTNPDLFTGIYFSTFSITFAILSKIIDLFAINNLKAEKSVIERSLRAEAAKEKIRIIQSHLSRSPIQDANLTYPLADLEKLLTLISQCCANNNRPLIKDHRDSIGGFLLQLRMKPLDSNLSVNYTDLMGNLGTINTTLLDI